MTKKTRKDDCLVKEWLFKEDDKQNAEAPKRKISLQKCRIYSNVPGFIELRRNGRPELAFANRLSGYWLVEMRESIDSRRIEIGRAPSKFDAVEMIVSKLSQIGNNNTKTKEVKS